MIWDTLEPQPDWWIRVMTKTGKGLSRPSARANNHSQAKFVLFFRLILCTSLHALQIQFQVSRQLSPQISFQLLRQTFFYSYSWFLWFTINISYSRYQHSAFCFSSCFCFTGCHLHFISSYPCLVFVLYLSCICLVFELSLSCICLVFVLHLSYPCLILVLSLSYLCLIFALSLPHICLIFVSYLSHLCLIFASSSPHLCLIFVSSSPHLCLILASSSPHLRLIFVANSKAGVFFYLITMSIWAI